METPLPDLLFIAARFTRGITRRQSGDEVDVSSDKGRVPKTITVRRIEMLKM